MRRKILKVLVLNDVKATKEQVAECLHKLGDTFDYDKDCIFKVQQEQLNDHVHKYMLVPDEQCIIVIGLKDQLKQFTSNHKNKEEICADECGLSVVVFTHFKSSFTQELSQWCRATIKTLELVPA